MKAFKTLVVFAAGAAAGYFISKNHIELSIHIDPVVDKIKEKLGVDFIRCECDCHDDDDCGCDDDVCECDTPDVPDNIVTES